MRIASPVLGPLLVTDLRVFVAGAILALGVVATGGAAIRRDQWKKLLVLGTLSAAAPFSLFAVAVLALPVSLTAILVATSPLFGALVAFLWLGESLSGPKVAGLLVGMAGVIVVAGWSPLPHGVAALLSVEAALLAALSVAMGGVYAGKHFREAPPLSLAAGQQLSAGLLLLPLAAGEVAVHPPAPPSAVVVLCVVASVFLPGILGFSLYFYLVGNVGATRALSVNFLVPASACCGARCFWRSPSRQP